jgi:asparagine synthetase B (glutamine-hydrolysing)
MCGIHVAISRNGATLSLSQELETCLANRGPDHLGREHATITADDGSIISIAFTSTVLSLRGDHVTPQPFRAAAEGAVLCWNGEAWKIDGRPVDDNDGEAIFARLAAASDEMAVLHVLRGIRGPFAFVYLDAPTLRLYFARDRLGRRSLLQTHDGAGGLTLSSVADAADISGWSEVEADGIYVLDLRTWHASTPPPVARRSWGVDGEEPEDHVSGDTAFFKGFPATYLSRSSTLAGSTRLVLKPVMPLLHLFLPLPLSCSSATSSSAR